MRCGDTPSPRILLCKIFNLNELAGIVLAKSSKQKVYWQSLDMEWFGGFGSDLSDGSILWDWWEGIGTCLRGGFVLVSGYFSLVYGEVFFVGLDSGFVGWW